MEFFGRERELHEILGAFRVLGKVSTLRADEIKPHGESVLRLREGLLGVAQEELAGFDDPRQRIQTNQISKIENGGAVKLASLTKLLAACRAVFESREAAYRNLPTPSWNVDNYIDHAATYRPRVAAVHGPAGIGKSTLAWAVAESSETHELFPDGVLTCALGETPGDPLQVLLGWAREMGCPVAGGDSAEAVRSTLAGRLAARRCLVVVDDVWQVEDALALAVWGGQCAALVTTRSRAIAERLAGDGLVLRLDGLPSDAAEALLRWRAPWLDEDDEPATTAARTLVEAVAGSPLGMRIAADLLSNARRLQGRVAIERLLAELADGDRLLDGVLPAELEAPDRPGGSATTLQQWIARSTSCDALDERLRERFAACAAFSGRPEAAFRSPAAAAVWDCDPDDAQRTLDQLVQAGLLDVAEGRFTTHALYHAHARRLAQELASQSPLVRQAPLRHAAHYADFADRYAASWQPGGSRGASAGVEFAATWPQFEAAIAWAGANLSAQPQAAAALELARCCEVSLSLRLPPRQWRQWAGIGLAAARLQRDDVACERNLRWLAQAHGRLGELDKAETILHEAIETAGRLDDPELLVLGMHMRGAILIETKRWEEAVAELERALYVARRIADKTLQTKLKAKCYGNLGVAWESLGEFDLALKNHRRQQRAAAKIRDDVVKSYALTNIGHVLILAGDAAGGVQTLERQALPLNLKLGHEPAMAPEYCYLGLGYQELAAQETRAGRIEVAEQHRRQSREAYRRGLLLATGAGDESSLQLALAGLEELNRTDSRASRPVACQSKPPDSRQSAAGR